ncbi:hypothetical protein EVJ50_03910 [Synechococcus sp. RSCCF101]|uniref:hypothetical protein n=1 Tax=Synechococcus sp. RSCCF101 TaxID=2511069 RepID=UPI0012463808|nr:hypothetical protein [Synechococcus sp. RSCCF101]QEY31522.1 hypothetical protein EVJ50_03910 [Synechococcus sp. RSCCF101]
MQENLQTQGAASPKYSADPLIHADNSAVYVLEDPSNFQESSILQVADLDSAELEGLNFRVDNKAELSATSGPRIVGRDVFDHSPMRYTDIVLILRHDGTWTYSHTAANRSRHSDWDVWINPIWFEDDRGNSAGELHDDDRRICYKDIDSGERFNLRATGNSSFLRANWRFIRSDAERRWKVNVVFRKRRDN